MPPGPKPSVRYWASRKAYGCWIGPDQHILAKGPDDAPGGPTYLEALDQFRKLVAQDDKVGTDDYLIVRGICDYCDNRNKKAQTDAWKLYVAMAAASYVRALLEVISAEAAE